MPPAPELDPDTPPLEKSKPAFLRRVRIRNYKSIAFCDVTLEPLTILVGRNASGKSNFLDALAFLRDVLCDGVIDAVKKHGGVRHILSRDAQQHQIQIEVESNTLWPAVALWEVQYSITVDFPEDEPPELIYEHLRMTDSTRTTTYGFTRQGMRVVSENVGDRNRDHVIVFPDDAFLRHFAHSPVMGFVSQLMTIRSYNFRPELIRTLQTPNLNWSLESNGENLASVLETMRKHDSQALERIRLYLTVVTESVELLGVARYGDYETVRFRMNRDKPPHPLDFDAVSMSDGTLRVLASLAAAFQVLPPASSPCLVAIEEPETALHPAAMRALVDALDEATLRTQILLTTHSAEMLDNPTIQPENIRVVQMIDGQTVITPVDEASVEIVRQKLNTLGGLERENQLEPNLDDLDRQRRLSQNGQEPKG